MTEVKEWLRRVCADYQFDLRGVFKASGGNAYPVRVRSEVDLERLLIDGGHLLPLPQEPAALANVLEVSIADHILNEARALVGAVGVRGGERVYPDLELSGEAFGGGYHAVDVKIARRGETKKGNISSNTQSAITLYTGNTYFKYPTLRWPGTFRPFAEYASHLDVIGLYTFDRESRSHVKDLELLVHEPWRIASRDRSSTTREYIGAVKNIARLRQGQGAFDSPEEFYTYWRRYKFKIGDVVHRQLERLLAEQGGDG